MSKRKRLTDLQANYLGLEIKKHDKGRNTARYSLSVEQLDKLYILDNKVEVKSETQPNEYNNKPFVLSAWNDGKMMNIDEYCICYSLPREDISSYKLVSHTGTPFYNIVFKEQVSINDDSIDFDSIIKKHIKPVENIYIPVQEELCDFETLTYTDVHIGMDTDKYKNSMYPITWNKETILASVQKLVHDTLNNRKSTLLVVDELGDFLDGFNAQTTRGGHALPQNMTNEEAFDVALEFKVTLLDMLAPYYEEIIFNNICNDNHAGSFGYFVNSAFKGIAERKYNHISIINYRQFINHYFVGDVCFVITHGKDDSTLKFGFKPFLDAKAIEKIDQYLKHNNVYGNCKRIIFKKGDSHQLLFDMCTSDDFYYFNYGALSPSSQWVQNNFKKGRRSFVLEYFNGIEQEIKPIFI